MDRAEDLNGFQISGMLIGINIAEDATGAQLTTVYNQADAMQGLQLGLVNVCRTMHGVQIGSSML